MCGQPNAPDPIINSCDGFYCDRFMPNSKMKPKMWTECHTGWYFHFGGRVPHRPVEDIAFAAARFFQRGGSFQNYYMYHGGTNFGRSVGGPFITTSYDYDAPIDEYGIPRQPKWGHLKDLHKSIKLCEEAMIATDPTYISLGHDLETNFDAPDGDDPIALDLIGMGKGEAWVDGQSIGRYWPTKIAPPDGCEANCSYRSSFHINKCFTGCGLPS